MLPNKNLCAMQDTYRHKGMRRRLVTTLRERGIADEAVLAAIEAVPRHFFLDNAFEEHAYEDKPFPIGNKQTISQPYTVAYQSSLLQIRNGDRVLEIGTGSGYQAAILAVLGARVFTVERIEDLHVRAKTTLQTLGFSTVRCFFRDGMAGLPEHAPFNQIIVTAGAVEVPDSLLQQLAPTGGTLVIPVGKTEQRMQCIRRTGPDSYQTTVMDAFKFVPFVGGTVTKKK
jgi:protein-L-isoaspartate(D-aspartate) O-methyltransferase